MLFTDSGPPNTDVLEESMTSTCHSVFKKENIFNKFNMSEDWQSQSFRQNVISKIHYMSPKGGPEPNKNASMIEEHIFRKSRTKVEYLGLVAKLFLHYKDMSQRKSQAQQQQLQYQQQPPPPNAEMEQQNVMQDSLNVLQNLSLN